MGIWRDLDSTNKLSSRHYIRNVSIFLTYSFESVKSPNFTIRKNKAKMLSLKTPRTLLSAWQQMPLLCMRKVGANQEQNQIHLSHTEALPNLALQR